MRSSYPGNHFIGTNMDLISIAQQIRRSAIPFQVGGFRPDHSPTTSWVGKVMLAKEGETWPQSNGIPMMPICQINLTDLPNRPASLQDIAFLTLFFDPEEIPIDTPNGDGWLLRTYSSLEELVPHTPPDTHFPLKPFQMKAEPAKDDYPCHEDREVEIPDEWEDEFMDQYPNLEGIKLGGWPTLIQSEIFWAPGNAHPADPEYVFQVDSVDKAHLFWGDGGVAYFGRGTKPGHENEWTFSWQCF